VPIKPQGMHERTHQQILGTLAYHEAIRKQGASYARKNWPINTALICGGSAEAGLWSLVDGRSANLHVGRSRDSEAPDGPVDGKVAVAERLGLAIILVERLTVAISWLLRADSNHPTVWATPKKPASVAKGSGDACTRCQRTTA
jgi:hypothetical protein